MNSKKLKSPKFGLKLLLTATIITIFTLIFIYYGLMGFVISLYIWYLYLILYVGLFLFRTKNPVYIVVILGLTSFALFLWATASHISNLIPISGVLVLFFSFWQVYLLFTRKLKWREREILELAAKSITNTTDGFTARPHPAGKIEYSKEDILKFAKFIYRNLIAVPYREDNRIVIAITGKIYKHILNLKNGYSKNSWVAIDFEGNVSVNISQKTYLRYKDDLTFDQLCQSLGDLFKDFFELYKNGQGSRILDRMDALKESVVAEA